jgi:hypothetical protein
MTSTHGEQPSPANSTAEIPYDVNQDYADGPSFFAGINYG